jgi:hypothetical protein
MPELSLTRQQVKTIATMTATRNRGGVTLLSPPEGDVFDRQYVEVRITDENGEVVETEILTWAGTRPNFDGRHLEGSD